MKRLSVATALLAVAISAAAEPPAAPLSGVAVDTCAMLSETDAVAVVGKLSKPPQAKTPRGSLLGECEYRGAQGRATLTAHPADELDGTVRSDLKQGKAKAIAGLGEKAFHTPYGVMFQPAGKPYFLVAFAMRGVAYDAAASEALARKVKP